MATRRLRARDRRALLLGLAVLAPASAYRIGVAPWLQYRSGLVEALAAERDLYARERTALAFAAAEPGLEESLRSVLVDGEAWMLEGGSSMAATGGLSRLVTELGRTSGILIQDVQALAAREGPGAVQLARVAVRATGDLEGISRFLHGIENGAPLLQVRELTLRTAGLNDGDTVRGQLLLAGIVIDGLWMSPTQDGGAP